MSKNDFSIRDNIIQISRKEWNKLAFAEYHEDYYNELIDTTWTKKGNALFSSKLGCYLHQFIVEKWYGKEMLDDMYKNGYIIEHLDNNEFNNVLSNLDFLLKDYNTAKGQSLDKDIKRFKNRIALRMYKNFKTGTYEISLGFNEAFDEILSDGTKKPIQAMHLLYERDYYSVILDANKIIHDYITLNRIEINKLSHSKLKIDYALYFHLTPEEQERVGNGKGGLIEREGKYYVIIGKNIKLESVHQIKDWK